MERVFITRGCGKKFCKGKFKAVQNIPNSFVNKPLGGLWACDIRTDDWKHWCMAEGFCSMNELNQSFLFTLRKGAKVLILDSPAKLLAISQRYALTDRSESLMLLDFEKLAKDYDAIEVRSYASLRNYLFCWDMNCLLVLNSDVIKPLVQEGFSG